jgi:hypothetical protein
MARIIDVFPQRQLTEGTIGAYMDVLEALPYERTRDGIEELLLSATFLPAIAEIVKAAGVEGEDVKKLAQAIREKKPLSRDYVFGWVVGEPLNPIPEPAPVPALSAPATVDVRGALRELAARFSRRSA